jgi:hypothetical protein
MGLMRRRISFKADAPNAGFLNAGFSGQIHSKQIHS